MNLTGTQGSYIDRQMAKKGEKIVLNCSKNEIKVLEYSKCHKCWYIVGYESVEASSGKEIPEADYYWHGIGYINQSINSYAIIEEEDTDVKWDEIYSFVGCQKNFECQFCIDKQGLILKFTPGLSDLFGAIESNLLMSSWMNWVSVTDREFVDSLWNDYVKSDKTEFIVRFRVSTGDTSIVLKIIRSKKDTNNFWVGAQAV